MASMPFGLAGMAYQGMTGNQPPGILQGNMGTNAANAMGLPQYQGAGERILGAGLENAVGGALLPGGATMGRMALGGAAGLAGQGAQEAGAGPMGQLAASAAVGMGLPVAGMVLSAGIRSALAGAGARRAAAQQTDALIQAGNPTAARSLGQVAEGGLAGGARGVEGKLMVNPGSAPIMKRNLDKQAAEMGERVEKIASSVAPPALKKTIGQAITRDIEETFIPNFKAKTEQLYQKVYAVVPPTTPVTPTAVTQLIVNQNHLSGMARELSDDIVNPKYSAILNHIDEATTSGGGTIPFAVMKELRSRLFAMENGDELVADLNMRDVRILRGALTEDMGAAVQKAGGTQATQDWNRAGLFYRKGMERIENVLQPIIDKAKPEQAYAAMMSGTKEGASALQSTLQSLSPPARALVRADMFRRLGRGQDGSFIPELYLKNMNRLAPDARAALFENEPLIGANLASLAKTASARQEMFNVAGTARKTGFQAVVNALGVRAMGGAAGMAVGGPVGAVVGGAMAPAAMSGVGNIAARVFTNPKMINWMVRQTKVPYGALQQELAILAKDAVKWGPDDRQTALDFVSTMQGMDWRSILLASAAADATAQRPQ
jgi:hypothetical protein